MRERVQLITDLRRYHPKAVVGAEGSTRGPSLLGDRFVWVEFDAGFRLEVLWQSLRTLDLKAPERMSKWSKCVSFTEVEWWTGSRGGFNCISYSHIEDGIPHHSSLGDRKEAERLRDALEQNKIPITYRVLR